MSDSTPFLTLVPAITAAIAIAAALIIIAGYLTSKTKRATNETDIGNFRFVFTDGDYLEGQVTLAQKLMSEEYLQLLAAEKHITEDQKKDLLEKFISKHYFYALKAGRLRYLLVSQVNITDTEYHVPLDQRFVFPFGWQSSRMVLAHSVPSERGGWQVRVITPLSKKTGEFVSTEIYKTMQNLGDACAVIKDLAIRIRDDIPYRELVESSRGQLVDAQEKLAIVASERDEAREAAGLTPLSGEPQPEGAEASIGKKGGITFGRLVFAIAAFAVPYLVTALAFPQTDPFLISVGAAIAVFLLYHRVKNRLFKKW